MKCPQCSVDVAYQVLEGGHIAMWDVESQEIAVAVLDDDEFVEWAAGVMVSPHLCQEIAKMKEAEVDQEFTTVDLASEDSGGIRPKVIDPDDPLVLNWFWSATREFALNVSCVLCGADPEDPCVDLRSTNKRRMNEYPHIARWVPLAESDDDIREIAKYMGLIE